MSLLKCTQATLNVLAEVADERIQQTEVHGEQDHPSVDPRYEGMEAACAFRHGITTETQAKSRCESAFAGGFGTYADIAIEEMAEVICAADDEARRAELVQVAAVAVAWIESIDRRKATAKALDSVSMDPPATAWAGSGYAELADKLASVGYSPAWPNRGPRFDSVDLGGFRIFGNESVPRGAVIEIPPGLSFTLIESEPYVGPVTSAGNPSDDHFAPPAIAPCIGDPSCDYAQGVPFQHCTCPEPQTPEAFRRYPIRMRD